MISENDICNELLAHWKEQDKPHLDDEEKCCYVLAVRAVNEIRRLRSVLEGVPQEALDGGWTAKGISAYARGLECEIERLRAEVEALRAAIGNLDVTGGGVCAAREVVKQFDAARQGGMMHENLDLSDINQVLHVVRNPYGWNEHVVRDARLKLADEFERLRAEVDALRGVHEAATRVFKFHAVNKRNFFMAFCDLESNLNRVAEIDAARKGE